MRVPTSVALLSLLAVVALPARAQSNTVPSDSIRFVADTTQPVTVPAAASSSQSTGAALTGLRAGVHARETARPLRPSATATQAGLGQARAMMIVGVAGLIAGAIIGGDPGTIIMVGGAVVGLIGLYEYLQ